MGDDGVWIVAYNAGARDDVGAPVFRSPAARIALLTRAASRAGSVRLQEMMLRDALELLGATVARLYLPTSEGTWRLEHAVAPTALPMPPIALEMEAALLPRALAAERSLISTHPCLDPTPWP